MAESFLPPAIVVWIDGSRSAVRATLWAIDEAVSRDIPLRLVYSIAPSQPLARAESAIRDALDAIASTHRLVKTETEIVHGPPTVALLESAAHAALLESAAHAALLESAAHAAMVCIGVTGLDLLDPLAVVSHCPVAIIGGTDRSPTDTQGWVVAALDQSPSSAAVLACGVAEARLRGAPLRVISSGHLDHRLEHWTQRYPDLDVQPVPHHGTLLSFLTADSDSIHLVVVGVGNTVVIRELLEPPGLAALRDIGCSVLITDRQRLF